MPFHVERSDTCPPSKPWACVKDATGEVLGCHASEADAQAQVDALYANERAATARYSDDQPRDDHGRFEGGGGGDDDEAGVIVTWTSGSSSALDGDTAFELQEALASMVDLYDRDHRSNSAGLLVRPRAANPQQRKVGGAVTRPRTRRDTTDTAIARARAASLRDKPPAPPCGNARSQPFRGEFRSKTVMRDGKELVELEGYASVVETPYDMWDFFGPYQEVISARAFDKTLAAKPDVAFLVNHRGVTMARTTNNTLQLSTDSTGLLSRAWLNPQRTDVRDLLLAVEEKNITEMSFAFTLPDDAGVWSNDFAEFRINETDINRGDVSAVNYGANPYTSVAARAAEILADLEHLPAGAARAAIAALNRRPDLRPAPREPAAANQNRAPKLAPTAAAPTGGRSIRFIEAMLATE